MTATDPIDWADLRERATRSHGEGVRAVLQVPGRRGRARRRRPGRERLQRRERVVRRHAVRRVLARVGAHHVGRRHGSSRSRASTGTAHTLMPCGRCRQLLYEHSRRGHAARDRLGLQDHRRGAARRLRPAHSSPTTEETTHERHRSLRRRRPDPRQARRRRARRPPQIDWLIDAYTRGYVGRRADVGDDDGDLPQRHGARARSAT